MSILNRIWLAGIILGLGASDALAQGDWRGQLTPTVDAEPQRPMRGQWPAGQANISIVGAVAEEWPNGLVKAKWDAGTRQLGLDFSPEAMAGGDLTRLSLVILASKSILPVGNFGARIVQKAGNLRQIAVGNFVANQTLYQVSGGVVRSSGVVDGVLRGSIDLQAVPVSKARGKVGANDKPIRMVGQFVVAM